MLIKYYTFVALRYSVYQIVNLNCVCLQEGIVSHLSSNIGRISPRDVDLLTEAIEQLVITSVNNATASKTLLTLIDTILKQERELLDESHEKFNVTGRCGYLECCAIASC